MTVRTRLLIPIAAALAVCLAATHAPRASATTSTGLPGSTSVGVHQFHGLQGYSNTLTLAQALQAATASDVISATAGQLAKYGAAMKAANPNVILLVYVNGGYSKAGTAGTYPQDEYLRSSSGAYITSTTWHNVLMNPLSSGWQQDVANRCAASIGRDVSGCWLDQTSCAPLTSGFDSAQPVDPSTGALYTKSTWSAAVAQELSAVQSALGSAPVYSNTYCSGHSFYAFPMSTADTATSRGLEAEHWFTAQSTNAENLKIWQQGIDMLIQGQADGKLVTVSGGYPTTGNWPGYITASYLLGDNGAALMTYSVPVAASFLGAPTDTETSVAGYLHGSVYARTYENGIVIVNPTGTTQTYAGHTLAAYSGYIGS
jgi:hypothetical protein